VRKKRKGEYREGREMRKERSAKSAALL